MSQTQTITMTNESAPLLQPIEIRPVDKMIAPEHKNHFIQRSDGQYRCISTNCPCGQKLYTRKNDVFRHIENLIVADRWKCPYPLCDHSGRQKTHVKTHINAIHATGDQIKWYHCSHKDCEMKWKDPSPKAKHEKTCVHRAETSEGPSRKRKQTNETRLYTKKAKTSRVTAVFSTEDVENALWIANAEQALTAEQESNGENLVGFEMGIQAVRDWNIAFDKLGAPAESPELENVQQTPEQNEEVEIPVDPALLSEDTNAASASSEVLAQKSIESENVPEQNEEAQIDFDQFLFFDETYGTSASSGVSSPEQIDRKQALEQNEQDETPAESVQSSDETISRSSWLADGVCTLADVQKVPDRDEILEGFAAFIWHGNPDDDPERNTFAESTPGWNPE